MAELLKVKNLRVSFNTYAGRVHAVRGVSFTVDQAETLAIVGESGSGKSVTAYSIMRLIPSPPGVIEGGEIHLAGRNLLSLPEQEMRRVRGSEIGMVFQDPMTSLNPTMTVGNQIVEVLKKHQKMNLERARARAVELLTLAGIPQAGDRFKNFPHQFSGGMRQRVMIAIALACNPKLLIADEPTTALDVTIQAQILDLMKDLKNKFKTSIILITHDLGVVANLSDRIAVMYAGEIVEYGTQDDIFYRPRHPYTAALLGAIPNPQAPSGSLLSIPGTPPDLFALPKGCAFAPRCQYTMRICLERPAENFEVGEGHHASCWLNHPAAEGSLLDGKGVRSNV